MKRNLKQRDIAAAFLQQAKKHKGEHIFW